MEVACGKAQEMKGPILPSVRHTGEYKAHIPGPPISPKPHPASPCQGENSLARDSLRLDPKSFFWLPVCTYMSLTHYCIPCTWTSMEWTKSLSTMHCSVQSIQLKQCPDFSPWLQTVLVVLIISVIVVHRHRHRHRHPHRCLTGLWDGFLRRVSDLWLSWLLFGHFWSF